jgi:SAM-dependent methyltransferase
MSWIEIAKTPKGLVYIHPSGYDEQLYNESGRDSGKEIQKYIKTPTSIIGNYYKVLEYGCGTGRIMRHVKECVLEGVDIAPEFVEACNKNGLKAKEIKDYKFEEDCDIIYSITVFIHLSKKDALVALKNIHKGLKKGGLALLQIPLYETNKEPNSFIDVGSWTGELLREKCKEIGFSIESMYANTGTFSYENIGVNHNKLQILKKI